MVHDDLTQYPGGLNPLQRFVETSGLEEGDRLPPERELAAMLGISRRNLRRSLARMEVEGRVWRGVGRGTFLGARPLPTRSVEAWELASPLQIIEARLALEPAIAAAAARNASTRDLASIDNCVRKNLEAGSDPDWGLWDAAFHRALAEATQNPILLSVMDGLAKARAQSEWGALRRATVDHEARRMYAAEHRGILEAVRRRDAEEAASAMRAHLRSVRDALFGTGP
jgi:DNA-binding FadR family transcriptional regulator